MPSANSRIVGIVRIDNDVAVDWFDSPSVAAIPARQTTFEPTSDSHADATVIANLPQLREELHKLFVEQINHLKAS